MRIVRVLLRVVPILVVAACAAPADAPTQAIDWAPRIQAANEALLNQGDFDRVPEFFSESYVSHGTEGDAGGHDAIRGFLTALRAAFPDLAVEVEVLATEGNRVAWIRTHRGTHQAEFMGVAATGNELIWQAMVVTRYENGMIAEEWGVSELGAVLRAQ
jgi:predicted ester cyclase